MMAQRVAVRVGGRISGSQRHIWELAPPTRLNAVRPPSLTRLLQTSTSGQGSKLTALQSQRREVGCLTRGISTASTVIQNDPMSLGNLVPAQRTKPRKRLGRGQGSGRGGTSTRGHNGQKSRAGNGKPKAGFEGGQTPITRRYPKRGFTNIFAKEFTTVNVNRIQQWIDEGRLDPTKPITARELYESACVHSFGDGIKLLAKGAASLSHPIHLIVSRASPAAIAAVENSGGSIVCKYYSRVSLRALVKPEKYVGTIPIRQPDPIHKRDLVYYSNPATRGYLASRQTPLKSEEGPDATSE